MLTDLIWTSSLIPAFSSRRRRIVRRPLENPRAGIGRTVNQITEAVIAKILSPGERTQVRAGVKQIIRRSRGDETHFKTGFWISVRASLRRLLRHGEGESSAVPLKIRAPGFAGHFGARIVPIRSA